ncbi:HIT domain-containing protein [Chloroflexota bacterium]
MARIWAPWRIKYIETKKPQGCILCEKPSENDDEHNYMLFRGNLNYIILNSYPYNPGHLMVTPYRHLASIDMLTEEERNEHFGLVTCCLDVLKKALNPQGFNMGINMGAVAGAGIADHVHTHVVPRWQGDTNFMPVLSGVRVIPEALAETYQKVKEHF